MIKILLELGLQGFSREGREKDRRNIVKVSNLLCLAKKKWLVDETNLGP